LLTARRDRFASLLLEAQQQFPAGGIAGAGGLFGIGFGVGSGGGFGGLTGGAIGASGAINPLATLEAAFGTGFTSQSIADAIRVAEQEGRFTGEGPVTGAITISTGAIVSLVLNLVTELFEIIDQGGKTIATGVTPQAALDALNTGEAIRSIRPGTAGTTTVGGGGGLEPLPFPRPSPRLRPLPLLHLRRLPNRPLTFSARSRHSSPSCNPAHLDNRLSRSQRDSPQGPNPSYPAAQSTSRSSWARPATPRGYVVRRFQTKSNSPERNRSGKSSPTFSAFGKQGRMQTSSAELLNSS